MNSFILDNLKQIKCIESDISIPEDCSESQKSLFDKLNTKHPEISLKKQEWKEFCDSKKISDSLLSFLKMPRFSTERNKQREVKDKVFTINLKQSLIMGDKSFYSRPDSFELHVKDSTKYIEILQDLKNKEEIFKSCKMPEMANNVNSIRNSINKWNNDNFYGFNRLTPVDAALIIARHYNFPLNYQTIIVPFKYFGYEEKKDYSSLSEMKKIKDMRSLLADMQGFVYQPKLYPLNKLKISETVDRIIKITEEMLLGHPIFDYFWAVVPSIEANHSYLKTSTGWKFNDKEYSSKKEIEQDIDLFIIEKELFTPVVLGERNGMCYFLCTLE